MAKKKDKTLLIRVTTDMHAKILAALNAKEEETVSDWARQAFSARLKRTERKKSRRTA